jgi:TIR domain
MADAPSPAPRPLRVFLCHASGDKPAVRELYQRLRNDGFQPWLDEEDLLPGQDWEPEIRKAVRDADVVLVCLSQVAITKKGFVQKEIKFALDTADEQPEGMIFIIPVKLEECSVPERLRRWHWVDLVQPKGYERLLGTLRLRCQSLGLDIPLVTPFPDDALQIWTASNLHVRDSVIKMTNTHAGGGLCINAYVFTLFGEMIACCSCLIPANGISSFSCREDLISNTLTADVPHSIIIKLLASSPIAGTCNASSVKPSDVASGLRAWGKPYGDAETPFSSEQLHEAKLTTLTTRASSIQTNGIGRGICNGCRAGVIEAEHVLKASLPRPWWQRRFRTIALAVVAVAALAAVTWWIGSLTTKSTIAAKVSKGEADKPAETRKSLLPEPTSPKLPDHKTVNHPLVVKATPPNELSWTATNLGNGDSQINIHNTGVRSHCANTYAFSSVGEMISCCACFVTPNSVRSYSVKTDILRSAYYVPTSVLIKLVASRPMGESASGRGGTCDPLSPTIANVVPDMHARGTTLHALPTIPVTYGPTETEFSAGLLTDTELTTLTTFCRAVQDKGSGIGRCDACRSGGL